MDVVTRCAHETMKLVAHSTVRRRDLDQFQNDDVGLCIVRCFVVREHLVDSPTPVVVHE